MQASKKVALAVAIAASFVSSATGLATSMQQISRRPQSSSPTPMIRRLTSRTDVVVGSSEQQLRRRQQQQATAAKTSVEGDFDPDAIAKARDEIQSGSIKAKIRALYKFTRPHTIRGTILASICGTVRALLDTPGAVASANWSTMLPRAAIGMLALLLGNAFIVGINQIYDESIDKLNKPFLPVASGEMSKRFAWAAVVSSAIAGPLLVRQYFPMLLFKLYTFGLFLGLIYSVPPLRTKKNPILAGLTIACVRGFLLNFGVYYAVKDAIGATFSWSPKVTFIARFMTIFATIIAVTKDLPDVEGDKVRAVQVWHVHELLPNVVFPSERTFSFFFFLHLSSRPTILKHSLPRSVLIA
jgi:homogentisate solanesyltransferase